MTHELTEFGDRTAALAPVSHIMQKLIHNLKMTVIDVPDFDVSEIRKRGKDE